MITANQILPEMITYKNYIMLVNKAKFTKVYKGATGFHKKLTISMDHIRKTECSFFPHVYKG